MGSFSWDTQSSVVPAMPPWHPYPEPGALGEGRQGLGQFCDGFLFSTVVSVPSCQTLETKWPSPACVLDLRGFHRPTQRYRPARARAADRPACSGEKVDTWRLRDSGMSPSIGLTGEQGPSQLLGNSTVLSILG